MLAPTLTTTDADRSAPPSIARFLPPITIRLADAADRPRIHQLRHEVFASELHQHPENDAKVLADPRYDSDLYVVAERGDELLGLICMTPPDHPRYAIERYFSREQFPFSLDGLYELRLLTVSARARGLGVSKLLMAGALRWVEEHGGVRLVATGHGWTRLLYQSMGMEPVGLQTTSGALELVLLTVTVTRLRERTQSRWQQLVDSYRRGGFAWQLDMPFEPDRFDRSQAA